MTETHVVSALRQKRAEVGGQVHDLEKKLSRLRATLAAIDTTLRVFSPDADPDTILPKRAYRRTRYFAKGELHRHCLDMLRNAKAPLAASDMAKAAMNAKGLEPDAGITERVLTIMRKLRKRGVVAKHGGTTQNVRWTLAKDGEQGFALTAPPDSA